MDHEETAEGSLAITIGLGKHEDEYFSMLVLDIEHDSGENQRFAIGSAKDGLEFASSLIHACETAARLDLELEGLTDEIDAEAAAMAFAMTYSDDLLS
jgi:hypothetical protein